MKQFISCHKIDGVTNIASLFFREIIQLYGVPKSIIYDHAVKFLIYF
jgi:hypothetical protein